MKGEAGRLDAAEAMDQEMLASFGGDKDYPMPPFNALLMMNQVTLLSLPPTTTTTSLD